MPTNRFTKKAAKAITLAALLQDVSNLPDTDLERFVEKVLTLRANRQVEHLSHKEADLLRQINSGLTAEQLDRWTLLNEKRRNEQLSPAEHTELIDLSEAFEEADARRIVFLQELAALRKTTVRKLMHDLGLDARHRA